MLEPRDIGCEAVVHSGPATFRPSTSPVVGSRISSQLTASSAAPVVSETANSTPSSFEVVERKSSECDKSGQLLWRTADETTAGAGRT